MARETIKWGEIEPDAPLQCRMIFDRTERDDGTREDETAWHKYAVKINGEDFTLFAPNDEVHETLQEAGINKKGQEFTITKKLDYNKKTKRSFVRYEVEVENRQPEGTEDDKGKQSKTPCLSYEEVAVPIWNAKLDWVFKDMPEEVTDNNQTFLATKLEIVKHSHQEINTERIQANGGKR